MKALEITTQIGCLNCNYCPQELLLSRYSGVKRMSFKTFKTCIDKLSATVNIHFSGFSEPFLNPDAVDMIGYAFNNNHKIVVYTTTIGLTEKKIEQLTAYIFKEFVVHVPDMETIFNENIWLRNIKYLEKYNIKFIFLQIAPGILRIKKWFNSLNKYTKIYQNKITRACLSQEYKSGHIKCNGNRFNQNVLLPNGDIYLCCEDYGLEYKLGNLLEQDYKDLFKSDTHKKIMAGLEDDSIDILCRKCERSYNDK